MRNILILLAATALFMPPVAWAQDADSLEGVWRATEIRYTGPNARTISPAQPGLLIFTGGYYSVTQIVGDAPRPDLSESDIETASAFQLRVLYGPFASQAGTYEVNGGMVTARAQVAQNTYAMDPGSFFTASFTLDGSSLTLMLVSEQDGPYQHPTTFIYSRVE